MRQQASKQARGRRLLTAAAWPLPVRFIQPPGVPAATVGCSNCSAKPPPAVQVGGWAACSGESASAQLSSGNRQQPRRQACHRQGHPATLPPYPPTLCLAGVDLDPVAAVVHHPHQVPAQRRGGAEQRGAEKVRQEGGHGGWAGGKRAGTLNRVQPRAEPRSPGEGVGLRVHAAVPGAAHDLRGGQQLGCRRWVG